MKKLITLFSISLLTMSVFAQEKFAKLELSGFIVTIDDSDTFSYTYDTAKDVEVKKNGDKLYLKVKPTKTGGFMGFFSTEKQERIPLKITTNSIKELKLSNCKLIYSGTAFKDDLILAISAASDVELTNIDLANGLTASFSSASNTKILSVKAKNARLEASSAADVNIDAINVDEVVKLSISSAANAGLKGEAKELNASVSSGADGKFNIKTHRVIFSASSGADIKAEIEAVNVKASASSGAGIKLSGSVDEATASASSGGSVSGKNLTVKIAANTSSSSGGSVSVKKIDK